MKLDIYRTLWGVEAPLDSFADSLKTVGFTGVEARVPADKIQRKQFADVLASNEMKLIATLFSGGDVIPAQHESPQQHIERVDRLFDATAELAPEFINMLAGNDRWAMAEQVEFFGKIQEMADERGIIWPDAMAPFQMAIVPLNMQKSDAVRSCAEELYEQLCAAGIEVLMDDRNERPGVKFADMELTGIPHRIVIGDRALADDNIEYKGRRDDEAQLIARGEIVAFLRERLG